MVARRAHNPEVVGSNPISATKDRPLTLFAFSGPVLTVFFFCLRKFPINFPYNEVFEARNNHTASLHLNAKAAIFSAVATSLAANIWE